MRLEVFPRTELTLRVMQTLADGRRWRAAQIAEEVGTSSQYVAQLVPPLTRAGWVRSVPGPTGGHELIADLDEVSVLDVIEAVEGPVETGRCVMADRSCPAPDPCALHEAWIPARDALSARLDLTPVAALTPHTLEVHS